VKVWLRHSVLGVNKLRVLNKRRSDGSRCRRDEMFRGVLMQGRQG